MRNFEPTPFSGEAFPWIGGDLQTLKDWFFPPVKAGDETDEHRIKLPDGDCLTYYLSQPKMTPKGLLILVHGLGGSASSQHALALAEAALTAGYSCMRVNMRGAGSSRPLCRETYHAQRGRDLLYFIDEAQKLYPDLPHIMVAHSLGGSVALNMLLDFPDKAASLAGMITISAPLDLIESSVQFHKMRNHLYVRYILSGLKALAKDCPDLPPSYREAAAASKSVMEFDRFVTAPANGFTSVNAYYEAASTTHRLHQTDLPLLLIHAMNDPWIPATPYLSARLSASTSLALSPGGGHIGFHECGHAEQRWHIKTALAFCDQLCK